MLLNFVKKEELPQKNFEPQKAQSTQKSLTKEILKTFVNFFCVLLILLWFKKAKLVIVRF